MTFNFGSRKNNYLHKKPHDIFLGKKSDIEKNSTGTKVTWNKKSFDFFPRKKVTKKCHLEKNHATFFLEERVT